MSLSSISRAAADQQLIDRVTASAYQAVMEDPDKASTVLGQALLNPQAGYPGSNPVAALMWPVATDTEASYEYAINVGKGAPGHDKDIITDAEIHDSVVKNWPMTYPADHVHPAPVMGPVNMPPDLPVDHNTTDT